MLLRGHPESRQREISVKGIALTTFLVAVVSGTSLTTANSVESEVSQPNFSLPFKLIDNRVFVDIRPNGQGPYHFILDTGADSDLSGRAAQRVGLHVEDAGRRPGGGRR
jgi:hypothetical protein